MVSVEVEVEAQCERVGGAGDEDGGWGRRVMFELHVRFDLPSLAAAAPALRRNTKDKRILTKCAQRYDALPGFRARELQARQVKRESQRSRSPSPEERRE